MHRFKNVCTQVIPSNFIFHDLLGMFSYLLWPCDLMQSMEYIIFYVALSCIYLYLSTVPGHLHNVVSILQNHQDGITHTLEDEDCLEMLSREMSTVTGEAGVCFLESR